MPSAVDRNVVRRRIPVAICCTSNFATQVPYDWFHNGDARGVILCCSDITKSHKLHNSFLLALAIRYNTSQYAIRYSVSESASGDPLTVR